MPFDAHFFLKWTFKQILYLMNKIIFEGNTVGIFFSFNAWLAAVLRFWKNSIIMIENHCPWQITSCCWPFVQFFFQQKYCRIGMSEIFGFTRLELLTSSLIFLHSVLCTTGILWFVSPLFGLYAFYIRLHESCFLFFPPFFKLFTTFLVQTFSESV